MDLLATSSGRKLLFFVLYLSEGAPIGYIWWVLPARLREAGIETAAITQLTALLVLPWALKFFWAPLVDILRGPGWTLRSWIIAAQVVMGAALLPLLAWVPEQALTLTAACLLVHAVAAATQDAAIDALCIASVAAEQRGQINGWMQAGMLLGRAAMGGGAHLLAARIGETTVLAVLIGLCWSVPLLVWSVRERPESAGPALPIRVRGRQFVDAASGALRQPAIWFGLAFAATAGAAYEGVGVVISPLLIDRDWSREDVGWFLMIPATGCMTVGSLLGGWLADRFGHRKLVSVALLVVLASVAVLAALIAAAHDSATASITWPLAAVYFGMGLFTASSYTLLMDLTRAEIAATQFSALMSATNICESWSSYAVGRIATGAGYAVAFLVLCSASLLSLLLVPFLRRPDASEETAAGHFASEGKPLE